MGAEGPGGPSGGTAAGSIPGGLIAYACGDPESATEATTSIVAATAAARSGRS